MNASHKGRRREHQSRDLFLDSGALVFRSAGSKGIADLVAYWPERGVLMFTSVKSNQNPPREEMDALQALTRRIKKPCAHCGRHEVVQVHRWDDRKPVRITVV